MYHNILIATDGSELADKAVDHGISLAKEVGASVIFVTVTERWSAIDMVEQAELGDADPIGRYQELAAESALRILDAAKSLAERTGVGVDAVHMENRVPAQGIIAAADENDCDLIVMASHGRRGFERIVLGSQTVEVLAYSKIPVLVLR